MANTITARSEIKRRVARATLALTDYLEADEHSSTAVTDLLADLRHYCDKHKLDFGDADRIAHGHYLAEIGGEL